MAFFSFPASFDSLPVHAVYSFFLWQTWELGEEAAVIKECLLFNAERRKWSCVSLFFTSGHSTFFQFLILVFLSPDRAHTERIDARCLRLPSIFLLHS